MAVRRLPVGAEVVPGGVHFRVWAPKRRRVEVVLEGTPGVARHYGVVELGAEENGYFSTLISDVAAGARYRYRLNGGAQLYADPASRFQPEGPEGPSQVVDPASFKWTDRQWSGMDLHGQVLYELHVGTFTEKGNWQTAAQQLSYLLETGVTALLLMPVADFTGRFGWGYDGVNMFAPSRLYGEPDDFRSFVDRAHNLGLAVLHDVVYNHFGPEGNVLPAFSDDYVSDRYQTDWGPGINFDGENSAPVREFFIGNAGYWIDEYHLDGLRLDATQNIFDRSNDHVLAAIRRRVGDRASGRSTVVIAENEPQQVNLLHSPQQGGYGLDAVWNDDFHHAAMVALTGRNEAYYMDYRGRPQEFVSLAKRGYLYQGQRYAWQKKRRGTPTEGIAPCRFVNYIQNHDQVANSGRGFRAHMLASPGRYKAMTAFLLLAPGTPLLFQGQEYGASTPFYYFADHNQELAAKVRTGRLAFLRQFRSLATPEIQEYLRDPADPETFVRSKLDISERYRTATYDLHRDLLRLRREERAFLVRRSEDVDGAVLDSEAFMLRFFAEEEGGDRLLLVNFGLDLHLDPAPEPLLAPPPGFTAWRTRWSTEDPRYGGLGTAPIDTEANWWLPGHAAVVAEPVWSE